MKNRTAALMEYLAFLKGKPASYIARALKKLGGGDMASGLSYIAETFNADKTIRVKKARLDGIAMGAIGTAIIGSGGIALYVRHREKKQCREKMQEITEILKQEIALSDAEQLPVDDGDITEED